MFNPAKKDKEALLKGAEEATYAESDYTMIHPHWRTRIDKRHGENGGEDGVVMVVLPTSLVASFSPS